MSINVKVDFNESYFRKLGLNKGSYKQVITQTMTTGAVKAEEITRREAPVKTGNLRRSINHFVKGSSESGVLQHGADYWVGVEYGTGPHVITPKGGISTV